MFVKLSPLIRKDPGYEIPYHKFKEMLKIKKVAQRYNADGVKTYKIEDNKVRYNKNKLQLLKNEKIAGPFVLAMFKTPSDIGSNPEYTYQGVIVVEEGEYAYVYRDSIDEYPEALFCDDTTLLMDIRNKETRTKTAIQIDGEPTWADCWDFQAENDDANHTRRDAILKQTAECAKELGIPENKAYAVIQLNC